MVSEKEIINVLREASACFNHLSQHRAFANDAPAFNEGGIGYETSKMVRNLIGRMDGKVDYYVFDHTQEEPRDPGFDFWHGI